MSNNDITGDRLVSKSLSEKGKENHERIFGITVKPKCEHEFIPLSGIQDAHECTKCGKIIWW